MNKIEIFTDGACSQGRFDKWPGGWAAFIIHNDKEIMLQGGMDDTTNNQMELMGFLEGLKYAYDVSDNKTDLTIYTDSAYIYNTFDQKWYIKWQKNGWITSTQTEVKNKELWISILRYHANINGVCEVKIKKVKAHTDNYGNIKADKMAVSMREMFLWREFNGNPDTI